MPATHPIRQYTSEVLRFKFSASQPPAPTPPEPDTKAIKMALLSILRAWNRQHQPYIVLLGLGSGNLIRALDAAMPREVTMVVCELDTDRARLAMAEEDGPWNLAQGRVHLLADTSVWAHLLLLNQCGIVPENSLIHPNPEATATTKDLRRILLKSTALTLPQPQHKEELTLGAILSEDDAGLDDFFEAVPAWIKEVVVLWDGQTPPARDWACAAPVRHVARPLDNDFAAQRNTLLEHCGPGWIISLDADERLNPVAWETLRSLVGLGQAQELGGFYLPRKTLYPDADHCLVGLGLWPDLQLRLFFNGPGVAYVRPIHERLTGLKGPFGISSNISIIHLNRILKSEGQIKDKLKKFDQAGSVRHTLSEEYPCLPDSFFSDARSTEAVQVLTLPIDLA